MNIFTAVIFDKRSVVPSYTRTFTTQAKAKGHVEMALGHSEGPKWEEWDEGKLVFGYGDEEVEDVVAAVYSSELEE
jgi:hypothetical protein